jgi:hypothetical protein
MTTVIVVEIEGGDCLPVGKENEECLKVFKADGDHLPVLIEVSATSQEDELKEEFEHVLNLRALLEALPPIIRLPRLPGTYYEQRFKRIHRRFPHYSMESRIWINKFNAKKVLAPIKESKKENPRPSNWRRLCGCLFPWVKRSKRQKDQEEGGLGTISYAADLFL